MTGCNGEQDRVIEVEKKVFLDARQREALCASLPEGKEKKFWDIYYDRPDMSLTKSDWWLRQRNGAWELKIPVSFGQGLNTCQSYEEVCAPVSILQRLQQDGLLGDDDENAMEEELEKGCPLELALKDHGVLPFCKVHTRRISIQARCPGPSDTPLMVDLDSVTFDPAFAEPSINECIETLAAKPFVIAEVEMMVPKGCEGDAASTLEKFLEAHGLGGAPRAYSKVLEYLLRFRPMHLDKLAAAGGVPRDKLEKMRLSMGDQIVPTE